MLGGVDALFLQPLVLRHKGQTAAVLVLLVVAALLIELQEAVEPDDLPGRAQIELAVAGFGQKIDSNFKAPKSR